MRTWRVCLVGVAFVGLGAASGMARGAGLKDDLSVVKHAVSASPAAPASGEAPPVPEKPKGGTPQWLKVRVLDKSSHKAKVTINLPLALARTTGEDFPIDWHCHGDGCEKSRVRLGDVLQTLESGQDIVQIEEEEQTVRVWVE
jgi:hypothetical protein